MSLSHPSRELFERFAGGELTADERREIVEHLLAGCESCRQLAERYWPSTLSPVRASGPRISDGVLARLQQREAHAAREREDAEILLASILADTPARRHTQVVNRRKFHTYAFCRRLQDESIARIFADPQDALTLAELALEVAQLVAVEDATPALLADLKARSWGRIANARKVLADFPGAEAGLAEARAWLARGTGDPIDDSELLEFEGGLRIAQRRFEQAETVLQRALRLHRRIGDRHAEGRALVTLAVMKNAAGDARESIRLLQQALTLLDAKREPRMVVNARHNLAVALANVGEAREALSEICALRTQYDPARDRASLLRLLLVEGRARHSLGDSSEAIAAYEAARGGFAEMGMPFDVAFASLELATVQLDLGALDAAQRLATETLTITRSLGVERDALGALMVIEEAAQRKALTRELVGEALAYLKQVRQNPGVKFRG